MAAGRSVLGGSAADLVQQAVEQFVDRHATGQDPDPAEFAATWPENLRDRIREQCERFLAFDRLVGTATGAADDPPAPAKRQFGDFAIEEELGRGGMGIVYLAHQRSLNRRVALKVLAAGLTLSHRHVERFRREATTAARLHHPGIVPVHSFAEVDGSFAFAMDYIAGRNLGDILDDLRLQNGPAPQQIEGTLGIQPEKGYVAECALLCAQVADALAAAHAAGIAHRDIKPRNLMIDDEHRVRLLDFGLAKSLDHGSISLSGEMTGTPHYMSPEQTLAKRVVLDHRTDIFSLGVILYELLTLRRPFDGRNLQQIVYEICFKEPKPIHQLNPRVPRDLVTVCAKALEKDPQNRYQTAAEFGQDLLRFLRWEPVHARPAGPLTRAAKWLRRHRTETIAAALVLAAAATAGAVAWYQHHTSWARGAALLAEAATHAAARQYEPAIALATEALTLRPGDSGALRTLELYRSLSESAATRQERDAAEANLLVAQSRTARERDRELALLLALAAVDKRDSPLTRSAVLEALGAGYRTVGLAGDEPVLRARLCPDGRFVATTSGEAPAVLWHGESGTELLRLRGRERTLDVAFHPDGLRLLTADAAAGATLWQIAGGQELLRLSVGGVADAVGFDRDGHRLFCSSYVYERGPFRVQVFETATGAALGSCDHTRYVECTAISPCGRVVASAGDVGFVRLWDAATGSELARLEAPGRVRELAFTADGSAVAVASGTAARIYAVPDGRPCGEARHSNEVTSVAFDRAGQRLLTAGRDNTARLWRRSGDALVERNVFTGRGSAITRVRFDTAEQFVLTGCDDSVVRVHDATVGTELMQYEAGAAVDDLAIDAEGSRVLIRAGKRRVLLWHFDRPSGTVNLRHRAIVRAACFDPAGELAVTAADDECVRVWNTRDGVLVRTIADLGDPVHAVDVDPRSQRILVGTNSGRVEFYSLWEGRKLLALAGHRKCVHVAAFAADGERVVTCSNDGTAVVWNARDAMPLCVVERGTPVAAAALAPGADLLATVDQGAAVVQLWTVPDGRLLQTLGGAERPVRSVAFTPDGSHLIAVGDDGVVRRHARDGSHAVLASAGVALGHVAIARDGRTLLTCSNGREHAAHLFDAHSGAMLVHFTGHAGPLVRGALSADGRWAISCAKDRTARIWPTDPVAVAKRLNLRPLLAAELQHALGLPTPTTTPK